MNIKISWKPARWTVSSCGIAKVLSPGRRYSSPRSFLYRTYGLGEILDDQVRLEPEQTAIGPVTPRSRMFSQRVKRLDLKNGKGLY